VLAYAHDSMVDELDDRILQGEGEGEGEGKGKVGPL
jgi:hypothetical protein